MKNKVRIFSFISLFILFAPLVLGLGDSAAASISACESQLDYQVKYGLTPEEKVFQDFLSSIAEHAKRNNIKSSCCFISYAWEDISTEAGRTANETLQSFLVRLHNDLQKAGIKTYLDIENLHGEIHHWMKNHIDESDFVIIIGSPRYKHRCVEYSNVAFEYKLVLNKAKQAPNSLIPLLYQGDFSSAFPGDIHQYLIRDIRNMNDYYNVIIGEHPVGIISAIYPSLMNDKEFIALRHGYEAQIRNLQLELELKLKNN